MSESWFDAYAAGDFLPAPANSAPACRIRPAEAAADPLLVVGTVIESLTARGVPVVFDGSLSRAVEAAERLLRCLGVESTDVWAVR